MLNIPLGNDRNQLKTCSLLYTFYTTPFHQKSFIYFLEDIFQKQPIIEILRQQYERKKMEHPENEQVITKGKLAEVSWTPEDQAEVEDDQD
jgi:hypothetical protein